ncbi:MAG: metal-dependent hydrolase [Pseudomonadales bacterium]|nr:metal-dependent hydrolase [Pseudomonadales bacterium]
MWNMNRFIPKPDIVSIKPKRMSFDFNNVPTYWFDNEPVQTHLLNALSLTFPDGERFFVDSVRAFRDKATSEDQKQQIAGFIGQEAMHSLEHNTFNEMLANKGYKEQVTGGQQLAQKFIAGGKKTLSKKEQLAATAALEHITAIMAQWLLNSEGVIEKIDPSVRDLWLWHAIEETEHKAVAFDLLQQVTDGNYVKRVRVMLPATWFLLVYIAVYTSEFLKQDGLHKKPLTIVNGIWQLVRPKGLFAEVVPAWFKYFKPGYHPWEDDDSHLIGQWREQLG